MKCSQKLKIVMTLTIVMAMLLSGCGNNGNQGNATATPAENNTQGGEDITDTPSDASGTALNPNAPTGTKGQGKYENGYRVIRIASWYDHDEYSSSQALDSKEGYQTSPEGYTARYNRLKEIEELYKVKFEYIRTTFEGIQISLDEGVLSGMPEFDIYEADIQFGMPAAMNGYCYALEDLTTADNDVFTGKQVFEGLKFPNQDKTYLWKDYTESATVYSLGFNWTLLQSKGLENPQDLYDRGEWTWDKFKDYAVKATDLSANPPIYGFTGLWPNHMNGFLRSNGTQIAGTPEGGLTSSATGEVLDLFKQLYVDLKVARPWNTEDWESNNRYADGTAAFFTAADWIFNGDSENYGGGPNYPLNYELGIVPYPVGPSGNKDANFQTSVTGNYTLIPKGVENPADVYRAFFDMKNWYGGDYQNSKTYDVIDPDDVVMPWCNQMVAAAAHGNETLAENNVRLQDMMMKKVSFDPWESMSIDGGDSGGFSVVPIMQGEMTAAQLVETYKQPLADALLKVYK